jgi:modification methylase
MSSSRIGDVVLDPFFGTGTTGVVAKKLKRNYIGIEESLTYVKKAQKRLDGTFPIQPDEIIQIVPKKQEPRIPFGSLLEKGLITPGELLTDFRKRWIAKVRADGSLISDKNKGSIHSVGAALQGLPACNGWTFWHIKRSGRLVPIDNLRTIIRSSA